MEKDFVKEICDFLKYKNIYYLTEVYSDDKKNRIDLIFKLNDEFFGIECKRFNTLSSGGIIAQSIKQINRYKEATYFNGQKIKRWGICFKNDTKDINLYEKRVSIFIRHFMNEFDFDYLEFNSFRVDDRFNRPVLVINGLSKNVIKISNIND